MQSAGFFDRDGTLIKDKNYLDTPEGIEWYPGAFETLNKLNEEYQLVVVTNQSGVARGMMTEDDVQAIHTRMIEQLEDRGISPVYFYYCPFLEDGKIDKYQKNSELRKPGPGMLEEASREHNLELSKSFMVGDKLSDLEAGRNAGCETILVRTGNGRETEKSLNVHQHPNHIVDSIKQVDNELLE